ncbi:hypothetical protein A5764_21510 [Mycobacterium sp. 852002-51057_SCH5723018]|nr:hypothetical protein A5764_21510 [Mycobacterium sp. 852002-51057_SCH5723018]
MGFAPERRTTALSKTLSAAIWRFHGKSPYELQAPAQPIDLSDDVGLTELAESVGLSAARVATLFRQGTGEPPHRWLMSRRVARACELLRDPSLSIGEIAHQCGFASPQHLATVMRRRLATTPTAYRAHLLG